MHACVDFGKAAALKALYPAVMPVSTALNADLLRPFRPAGRHYTSDPTAPQFTDCFGELQLRQAAMARTDIANFLRLAPETVSRVLRRFQQDGLVNVDRREVERPSRSCGSSTSGAWEPVALLAFASIRGPVCGQASPPVNSTAARIGPFSCGAT